MYRTTYSPLGLDMLVPTSSSGKIDWFSKFPLIDIHVLLRYRTVVVLVISFGFFILSSPTQLTVVSTLLDHNEGSGTRIFQRTLLFIRISNEVG